MEMNRKIVSLLALLIMEVSLGMTVRAGEQVLMETVKETDIYEKADTGSSVLATLEQGQPVICCEVSGSDGWL